MIRNCLCLVSVMLFTLNQLTAQKISGYLLDSLDESPISYACILNYNGEQFTYSNSKGYFELPAVTNDTIEVSHLGYRTCKFILGDAPDTILLNSKPEFLNEVVITNSKRKHGFIGLDERKNQQFGLSMNSEYSFLIQTRKDVNAAITKIEIPIKNRKDYSSEGKILVQLFKAKKNGELSDEILSPLFESDVSTLSKSKLLTFDLEQPISLPESDFYVLIKRIVPNKLFMIRAGSYSVNPFIYISKDVDAVSYEKLFVDSEWTKTSERFGDTIAMNIKIHYEEY